MKPKIILLILATAIISGCFAGLERVEYREAPKPTLSDKTANVYIYRSSKGKPFIARGDVNIYANSSNIASLSYNEFTWVSLRPGDYNFKSSWDLFDKPLFEGGHLDEKSFDLKVVAGKTYYINYEITQDRKPVSVLETEGGLLGKAISETHVTSVSFSVVDKELGSKIILGCWYRKPS